MFKIRYDMTSGQLRRTGAAIGPARRRRVGNSCGVGGGGAMNRYSPVFERAEDPTLADDFLPADPQTQNKLWRQIVTMDPIAGPATEYWKELAFGEKVILSGVDDPKAEQTFYDAIEASGIESNMPNLLGNYLQYGSFVFHMIMDEAAGFWNETIVDDLDFCSITVSRIPSQPPIIDFQPTQEDIEWATNPDPRFKEQRMDVDPVLIKMMALGQPIPLSPENTMFMARKADANDHYGTSYLTRILPFWIYEKALMDASVQGARRKAGPLYVVTAWQDAAPSELNLLDEMFAAAEEDPVGGRIVTRDGVNVNPIGGGGSEIWKWSDELEILSSMKMRALGISESLLTGEATYNSMEAVLSVFLQKLKSVRRLFTQKIIVDKICRQIAENWGFYKRPQKQIRHGYRMAAPRGKKHDAELVMPSAEWDEPLEPTADREYFDMLQSLDEKNVPISPSEWAQAAGYDLRKHLDAKKANLDLEKEILEYKRAQIDQREEFGFGPEGEFMMEEDFEGMGGDEGGLFGGGGGGGGFGDEGGLFGGDDEGGLDLGGDEGGLGELGGDLGGDEGGGDLGGGGDAFEEGFGADSEHARFRYKGKRHPRRVTARGKKRRPSRRRSIYDKPPPVHVKAEVVTAEGHNAHVDRTLAMMPLWDDGDTLFGLRRRHAAKILDKLQRADPRDLEDSVRSLPAILMRREGLSHLQAEAATYLAMRMGFVPHTPLSTDTYEVLGRYVTGKMNGSGLTNQITNELTAMSAMMQRAGKYTQDRVTRLPEGISQRIKQKVASEQALPHHKLLTGTTE